MWSPSLIQCQAVWALRILNQHRPMAVLKNLSEGEVGRPAIVRRGRNTLQTLCGSTESKNFVSMIVDGFESKMDAQPIQRPQSLGFI